MKDINKKCAEILEKSGYNFSFSAYPENSRAYDLIEKKNINPFYIGDDETLELWARRQSDAIEQHIRDSIEGRSLWSRSFIAVDYKKSGSHYQHKLDRIKWCLQQLDKEEM